MSYEEMLPADIFTRPRRAWRETIQIKHLLNKDEHIPPEHIAAIGKKIAQVLQASTLFTNGEIINTFEDVDDLEAFNDALNDMYDECDRVRIWVQ